MQKRLESDIIPNWDKHTFFKIFFECALKEMEEDNGNLKTIMEQAGINF